MQKNNRSSIFFLLFFSLSQIEKKFYNYRKNNSNKFIQKTIISLALIACIFSIAFISYFTFVKNKTIANEQSASANQVNTPTQTNQQAEYKTIN